jgi:hypothetical protein
VKRRGKRGAARAEATQREKEGVGMGARWVGIVDQYDTNTVAMGCYDSGGRLAGAAGAGYEQGR